MTDSAESVVRRYFAAFVKSDVEELISFFSYDALYVDGRRGIHRGIDAIRAEFEAIVQIVPSATVDKGARSRGWHSRGRRSGQL